MSISYSPSSFLKVTKSNIHVIKFAITNAVTYLTNEIKQEKKTKEHWNEMEIDRIETVKHGSMVA